MINNNNNNLSNNDNDTPMILPQQDVTSSPAPTITFATHNINSLQCSIKNQFINDSFANFNTDFISLTETRHKADQSFRNLSDPNYSSYWSNNINPYAGVGLLIKKPWAIYVQKAFLNHHRFIYIDLYLAGNVKLRIFCIYLHASTEMRIKKERLKLHKDIITTLKKDLS